MPGYGIKISLPGKDVQTCAPVDCSLHSDYTAFKSRLIGQIDVSANTWVQIPHNFGYAPAYSLWYTGEACGVSGIKFGGSVSAPYNDGSLESYVTTTALFVRATKNCTMYYYLYADDAGTISSHVPIPDYGGHGLMISRKGVDVTKAKPYELNFLSTYPNFKVKSTKAWSGAAIERLHVDNPNISDNGDVNWQNADNYGQRGLAVISGFVGSGSGWHWINALEWNSSGTIVIVDNLLNEGWEQVMLGDSNQGAFTASLVDNVWVAEGGPFDGEIMSEGNGWEITTGDGFGIIVWRKQIDNNYALFWPRFVNNSTGEVLSVWWYDTGGAPEYAEEIFSFTGTNQNAFIGVSRGQHGTNPTDWRGAQDVTITPLASLYEAVTTDTPYRACYFPWSINAFEANGGLGLPFDDGNNALETLQANGKIYFISRRRFFSEDDDWRIGSIPYVIPGLYVKIMHDEIGT